MTREDEAKSYLAVIGFPEEAKARAAVNYDTVVALMCTFADAEAAAMRERAAGHCDKLAKQFTSKLGNGPILDEITKGCATIVTDAAAAIRALPATGEVGRA